MLFGTEGLHQLGVDGGYGGLPLAAWVRDFKRTYKVRLKVD